MSIIKLSNDSLNFFLNNHRNNRNRINSSRMGKSIVSFVHNDEDLSDDGDSDYISNTPKMLEHASKISKATTQELQKINRVSVNLANRFSDQSVSTPDRVVQVAQERPDNENPSARAGKDNLPRITRPRKKPNATANKEANTLQEIQVEQQVAKQKPLKGKQNRKKSVVESQAVNGKASSVNPHSPRKSSVKESHVSPSKALANNKSNPPRISKNSVDNVIASVVHQAITSPEVPPRRNSKRADPQISEKDENIPSFEELSDELFSSSSSSESDSTDENFIFQKPKNKIRKTTLESPKTNNTSHQSTVHTTSPRRRVNENQIPTLLASTSQRATNIETSESPHLRTPTRKIRNNAPPVEANSSGSVTPTQLVLRSATKSAQIPATPSLPTPRIQSEINQSSKRKSPFGGIQLRKEHKRSRTSNHERQKYNEEQNESRTEGQTSLIRAPSRDNNTSSHEDRLNPYLAGAEDPFRLRELLLNDRFRVLWCELLPECTFCLRIYTSSKIMLMDGTIILKARGMQEIILDSLNIHNQLAQLSVGVIYHVHNPGNVSAVYQMTEDFSISN